MRSDSFESGVLSFEIDRSFPMFSADGKTDYFARQREDYSQKVAEDIKLSKVQGHQEFIKWGKDNKLPYRLMDDMFNNPLSLGILYLKADIAYGGGMMPYKKIIEEKNGKKSIVREPIIDAEIDDWLESTNAGDFAEQAFTDFYATGNFFAQPIYGKGMLLKDSSRLFVSQIIATDASTVRLGIKKKGQKDPDNFFVNDWVNNRETEKEAIPAFDKYRIRGKSMFHGRRYVTTQPYYGVPQHIGADKWAKQIALVPDYILALMQNILAVRFIVKIPKDYWEKNGLVAPGDKEGLKKARQKTIDEIKNFLSGVENAGKAIAFFKDNDAYKGIEIEAVKDETKYDAFLPNYEQGVTAITNAYGVDPSLAGIKVQGKLTNAAEQHWSYRIHNMIRTPRIREEVASLFNWAIKINFPRVISENICIGFENLLLEPLAENKTGQNKEMD